MSKLFTQVKSAKDTLGLEIRSDLQRKRDFLRSLLIGLFVLHGLALPASLSSGDANIAGAITVFVSAVICFGFYTLAKHVKGLSVNIGFCIYFNTLIVFAFSINLTGNVTTESLNSAAFLGYFLSLNALLSGILVSPKASFAIAGFNASAAFFFYYLAGYTANYSFPLITLIFMTAIISWLYERTLGRAHERLRLAQERILHDELVRRDLDIARDLQRRLYPAPPQGHSQISIASRSEPARETSGDFYDFIELGDDQLGIVIADVTGKSLAAALVMAMVRSTFRCEAHHSQSPAEVLRRVNEILCLDHSVKHMVTAWYGVLNTRSLLLREANAGHPFPMLLRDGKVTEIEAGGFPLRAQPGTIYMERTTQLRSADLLVLLSDGLVETMNGNRELFGFDRFTASLEHQSALQPQELIDHLWRQIDDFRGEVEQSDDMTLVVVGCERVPDAVPFAAPSPALAISQPTGAP